MKLPDAKNINEWSKNMEDMAIDNMIEGLFDRGDKVAIIAPPKKGKTMLALQLAGALTSASDFFGFKVREHMKVVYLNLEVKPEHFKLRILKIVRRIMPAHFFTPEVDSDLATIDLHKPIEWFVFNWRGYNVSENIADVLTKLGELNPDVIVVDPLYQILIGEENNSNDMMTVMRFIEDLTFVSKTTVIFVHHDGKGSTSGKRETDRGSGSNILARQFDTAVYLSDHKLGGEYAVLSFICRNYASPGPITLRLVDGLYEKTDEAPVRESYRIVQNGPRVSEEEVFEQSILYASEKARNGRPIYLSELSIFIREKFFISKNRSEEYTKKIKRRLEEEAGVHPVMLKKASHNRFLLVLNQTYL